MLENYFHGTQNYYFINVDGNYDKKKTGKMIYPFKELHANKKEVHVCLYSHMNIT